MSQSQRSSKSQPEKLRSSCDSCHLSKVKCSKSRPLCSRCLVCGTDCTYSPSARVGRKRKGEHSSEHTAYPTTKTRNREETQSDDIPLALSPGYSSKQDDQSYLDFDQGSTYTTRTPSTSGYITPNPTDDFNSTIFTDPQSPTESWFQSPGAFDYLPWGTDAGYTSLLPPGMAHSDPNNPWEIWYNTEAESTSYINPAMFQYPPNAPGGTPQYTCYSSANV